MTAKQQFSLEALEPRLLLSGDGLDAGGEVWAGATSLQACIEEVFEEPSPQEWKTERGFSGYDCFGPVNDIFGGLRHEELPTDFKVTTDGVGAPESGELDGKSGAGSNLLSAQEGLEPLSGKVELSSAAPSVKLDELVAPSDGWFGESGSNAGKDSFDSSDNRNIHLTPEVALVVEDNLVLTASGLLDGSGKIFGDVVTSGILSPGNSPGIINIVGNLTVDGVDPDAIDDNYSPIGTDTVGTIRIEIGGLTPGPGSPIDNGYDQINVGGNVDLGGAFDLVLINNFGPSVGQTFDFLTFTGTLTGKFDSGSGLFGFGDGGLYFDIVQLPDRLRLEVKQVPGGGGFSIGASSQSAADTLGELFSDYFSNTNTASITGNIAFTDFVEITGSFGFEKTSSQVKVVAQNVTATFGNDSFSAGVENAELALLLNNDGTKVVYANGDFKLSAGDFANAAGTVIVKMNTTSTAINSETVSVGGVSVTLDNLPAGVESVSGNGLSFDVVDFVSLSGNLGFKKSGTEIVAVGSGVTAELNAGPAVYVRLSNADFGVRAGSGSTAFELKNGSFSGAISGLADITASGVLVRYTGAAGVTAGTTLTVGSVSYTFEQAIAANTVAVAVTGFAANVSEFVSLRGDFSFEKSGPRMATLSDGTTKEVSGIWGAAQNANVFVGINGPATTAGAMGLSLRNVSFALAVLKPTDTADTSSYYGLKASASSVSPVGLDFLTLSVKELDVVVNGGSDSVNASRVVDFTRGDLDEDGTTTGVTRVATGPSSSIDLDMAGQVLEASGSVTLAIEGFVVVSGDFAFRKGARATATLSDGVTVKDVTALMIGANNVDVFVGVNGPASNPNAVGLSLTGVGFALALVKPVDTADTSSYYGLQATAQQIALVGIDELSVEANALTVLINGGTDAQEPSRVVDFSKGDLDKDGDADGVTTVKTGPATAIDLDMTGKLLQASGNVTLKTPVADLSGEFLFQKSIHNNNTPADTADDFNATVIAATNVTVFLGDKKGTPDDESDDVGVKVAADFVVLLKADKTYAFEAAGAAALVDIDDLTLEGSLTVKKNTTGQQVNRTVTVGQGAGTITRTLNLAAGASSFGGSLKLMIAEFVDISGAFSFEKTVVGPTTKVKIAATGVSVFLGTGAGTDDELGLKLTDGNLGLVLLTTGGGPSTYALSAAGTVALVGLPGLAIQGTVGVRINKTGIAINEADLGVNFTTGAEVLEFRVANAVLEIAGIFRVEGTVIATKTKSGAVLVDIPEMSMALTMNGQTIVGLSGAVSFTMGGADGFKLRSMRITGFAIFGIDADDAFPVEETAAGSGAAVENRLASRGREMQRPRPGWILPPTARRWT